MTVNTKINTTPEKSELNIGFIPLTDCATLAVAKEKGFFSKYGLNVKLSKEASWANIRDKLGYGILDCAQMLATMPISSSLGMGGWKKETITSLALGLNGNAITVSSHLYNELKQQNPDFDKFRPVTADTLKIVIDKRKSEGKELLNFAHVFPASTHNYFLRYWLASAGIDPDIDVKLTVIPPQQMVKNLDAGIVDGFCVGEPWNHFASSNAGGHMLITSYEIWNNAPDKVLGVNKEWAYKYPNTHQSVIKALIDAAQWIDQTENKNETAEILSQEEYINIATKYILPSLTGIEYYKAENTGASITGSNIFFNNTAAFPWHSHAAWYISQMMRWGDLPVSLDVKNIIKDIFWGDFYRQAVLDMGLDYPLDNYKAEGEHSSHWQISSHNGEIELLPDMFFDGKRFDFTASK